MSLSERLLVGGYFPRSEEEIPFGRMLNQMFFLPHQDNKDFPIHGPNVIRFVEALVEGEPTSELGLIKSDHRKARDVYLSFYPAIMHALEVDLRAQRAPGDKHRTVELLKVAALYHDLGKVIRRANHPQVGSNLLRNYSEEERRRLVDLLVYGNEPADTSAKYNRFSLIGSIIQHHDKFGVVCTGEAGLPLFSDILYFTSDETTISGIKKNMTSVMLMNLADIAAVNTASQETKEESLSLAKELNELRRNEKGTGGSGSEQSACLAKLLELCKKQDSCLGIGARKISQVLTDWRILLDSIEHTNVKGNRVQMKIRLLEIERNPARAILRILRLLEECSETANASALLNYMSPTSVESILVGTLGAHQFQTFCEQLATVAKLDYGLKFFQAVVCACVRAEIHDNYRIEDNRKQRPEWSSQKLTDPEAACLTELALREGSRVSDLASKITTLFVRVLEGLVSRYAGVFDTTTSNPRRFGFQMRDLTDDKEISDTIIDLLCIKEHKDPIALTWIVDEVTMWSMD